MKATIVQAVKSIVRQLVTGKDNQTHDIARYAWIVSTLAVLAHDYYLLTHIQAGQAPPNVRDLAIALATLAGAFGLAINLKAKSEPDAAPREAE